MDATDSLLVVGEQLPAIQFAVMIVIYVVGFILCGAGLWSLASAGQSRGGGSHNTGGAISMFIFGALMLNVLGTVNSAFATLYPGNVSPEYVLSAVPGGNDPIETWIKVLFNILVVFGWIAAGRGLYSLARARSRQEGGYRTGIVFLVAAVFLCNPTQFAYLLGNSFGATNAVSIIIPPP